MQRRRGKMDNSERIARIKQDLQLRWDILSEDITAVYQDLALEMDGQRTITLKRKLRNLEAERESITKQIEVVEQGLYRPSEEIIAEDIANLKKRISEIAQDRVLIKHRVVNHRPPIILCNFKDREEELSQLLAYLRDSRITLVSIVGQAGIGKTALICKAFAELEKDGMVMLGDPSQDIDGIVYLDMHPASTFLDHLFKSAVELLSLEETIDLRNYWKIEDIGLGERMHFLLSKLKDGTYFFVIDNFESVLDPDGQILNEEVRIFTEAVLTTESKMHIVVISRERLTISPILSQKFRRLWINRGIPYDLAAEYLRDLDPNGDFGIRDAPHDVLLDAARKVYGIPRALETIASIMSADLNITLSELLEDRRLFSGRVVENLVSESYHKLEGEEKLALNVLAVFDRPVEFVAVAYVLNGIYPDMNVAVFLKWLVNRHFIVFDRNTRLYGIHPLIQLYAYTHMSLVERKDYEVRAAEFYLGLRLPQSSWNGIENLNPQLLEFQHLVNAELYNRAANLLDDIEDDYLRIWGHYRLILEMRKQLNGKLTKELELINREKLGRTYSQLGEHRKGMEQLESALELANQLSDPTSMGKILADLGLSHFSLSRYDTAIQYYNQALVLSDKAGDQITKAYILGYLGNVYRRFGQHEKSRQYFHEALVIDRQTGHLSSEARHLFDLGISSYFDRNYAEAKDYYDLALSIAQQIGHVRLQGYVLGNLGNIHLKLGNSVGAIDYYKEALAKNRQTGSQRSEARNLGGLGDAYFLLSEYQIALEYHQQAFDLATKTEDCDGECIWQVCIGIDLVGQRDLQDAQEVLTKAASCCELLCANSSSNHDLTRCYLGLAFVGLAIFEAQRNRAHQEYITKAVLEFKQAGIDKAELILPIIELLARVGLSDLEPIITLWDIQSH